MPCLALPCLALPCLASAWRGGKDPRSGEEDDESSREQIVFIRLQTLRTTTIQQNSIEVCGLRFYGQVGRGFDRGCEKVATVPKFCSVDVPQKYQNLDRGFRDDLRTAPKREGQEVSDSVGNLPFLRRVSTVCHESAPILLGGSMRTVRFVLNLHQRGACTSIPSLVLCSVVQSPNSHCTQWYCCDLYCVISILTVLVKVQL